MAETHFTAELVDSVRLSLVSGVGPLLRKALLERFGSPAAVLAAAKDELQCVDGIGPKIAARIVAARDEIDAEAELQIGGRARHRCADRSRRRLPAAAAADSRSARRVVSPRPSVAAGRAGRGDRRHAARHALWAGAGRAARRQPGAHRFHRGERAGARHRRGGASRCAGRRRTHDRRAGERPAGNLSARARKAGRRSGRRAAISSAKRRRAWCRSAARFRSATASSAGCASARSWSKRPTVPAH